MKKITAILLILIGIVSCNSQAQKGSLSPDEFEAKLNTGAYQLLDVRTANEYKSGYLKKSLQADWNNPSEFKDRAQYLDKTKPVLVYCASGVRSSSAADYLLTMGFKEVSNLQGGLVSWKRSGKPVESAANFPQMTLDEYATAVKKDAIVLVDFGAEWCPPCIKMEPVLNQLLSDASLKFSFVKVDGGNDTNIMNAQNVAALPVFIVYKNGVEVWRKQGVVEQAELKKQLSK